MADILNFATGKGVSAASAVAVNIELGWEPKYVKVWTSLDATNGKICEWWETMGNGGGMLTSEAGVVSTATAGITIRSNYVDASNHDNDYAAGFTIGTDAQYDALDYYWMAM